MISSSVIESITHEDMMGVPFAVEPGASDIDLNPTISVNPDVILDAYDINIEEFKRRFEMLVNIRLNKSREGFLRALKMAFDLPDNVLKRVYDMYMPEYILPIENLKEFCGRNILDLTKLRRAIFMLKQSGRTHTEIVDALATMCFGLDTKTRRGILVAVYNEQEAA